MKTANQQSENPADNYSILRGKNLTLLDEYRSRRSLRNGGQFGLDRSLIVETGEIMKIIGKFSKY